MQKIPVTCTSAGKRLMQGKQHINAAHALMVRPASCCKSASLCQDKDLAPGVNIYSSRMAGAVLGNAGLRH